MIVRISTALVWAALLLTGCRSRDERANANAPRDGQSEAKPAAAATGWNDGAIAWRSWAEGKTEAAQTKKPICLVFFTTWCPHCTNYAKVFHEPRVVAAAKDFVMIRVDRDLDEELSARYAPDGQYIPRTYFLRSNGELAKEHRAGDGEYQWFFDEHDPEPLLQVMRRARSLS